jgi:hypothetical protein
VTASDRQTPSGGEHAAETERPELGDISGADDRETDSLGELLETETVRPSLVSLAIEIRELETELLDGLASRRAVIEWCQRVIVRTLGSVDDRIFRGVARQFADPFDGEGALLAAMLAPEARSRPIDEPTARELRERFLATYVGPAFRAAFVDLRKGAGEYLEPAEEGDAHRPDGQRWIAMRPSLSELDRYQRETLQRCLDGLEDTGEIFEWSTAVTLATHGEASDGFLERCYIEDGTRELLLGDDSASASAREHFAAFHLLPRFNAGARDLAGRSGELPDRERTDDTIPMA